MALSGAFEKKYSDDVTHLASQKQSVLMGLTRVHRNVVGATHDFHKMAGLVAATRANGSSDEVTGLDAASSVVTATLTNHEVPIYVPRFDQFKTSVDAVSEYQIETVAAINRKIDDIIIASMAAATTTLATTAGGLTYAKLLEAVNFFMTNDVEDTDRVFVLSPKAMTEALAITQLTSSDYMQVQAIMNAGIGKALGMTWVVSNRLPLATAARTCFAFNKKAVGVAVGQDLKTEINYIPQRVATLINSTVSLGSVVIDNLAIAKMTTNE
ncbi:MAG: phage capsid protein [Polaromonas sp.]|nr:phage capsid protein [Polaromonas sp.]